MSNSRELYNRYYDFYGELLTPKQQNIFTLYYREDLSLGEISENEGISRSAVSDTLKHCRQELQRLESHLHMYSAFQKRMKLYNQIRQIASDKINVLVEACIDTEIEGGKTNE